MIRNNIYSGFKAHFVIACWWPYTSVVDQAMMTSKYHLNPLLHLAQFDSTWSHEIWDSFLVKVFKIRKFLSYFFCIVLPKTMARIEYVIKIDKLKEPLIDGLLKWWSYNVYIYVVFNYFIVIIYNVYIK